MQGAELLCLVGPGRGHPASPPLVPPQVMQQIASGFKSADVTSATPSARMLRLLPGIGWAAEHSLRDGLSATIDWMRGRDASNLVEQFVV